MKARSNKGLYLYYIGFPIKDKALIDYFFNIMRQNCAKVRGQLTMYGSIVLNIYKGNDQVFELQFPEHTTVYKHGLQELQSSVSSALIAHTHTHTWFKTSLSALIFI